MLVHKHEGSAMGDVVNLRQFRKERDRKLAESKAEANRLTFGRTKQEREMQAQERDKLERHIEGHRLDPDKRSDT
jgi:hypothetical protein